MIKIARLTISYAHDTDDRKMGEVLQSHMDKCGVSMSDISISGNENDYGKSTHFGNWVLVPCLDNDALKKLADSMGTGIDLHDAILEQSDIDCLKVKDKVSVKFVNDFGMRVASSGRVLEIKEDEIMIMQKNKRKYGWVFNVGTRVFIEKIK